MKPETRHFLNKAHQLVDDARRMFEIELFNAAGRTAYLAGFHAAQALIFERVNRVVKTHNGVRTTFQQLASDLPDLPAEIAKFLANTYDLKATADYATGPDSDVTVEQAKDAVDQAHRFVAYFTALLDA